MNLNSAYIFVCVVQERGFTAAAERLNMPKQTVSKKIAKLEKELGSRLLERSTRKLRLTSEPIYLFQLFLYNLQQIIWVLNQDL